MCAVVTPLSNAVWAEICAPQVSPLFGTIYSSVLFVAHAVHRVRQSRQWMSGGNLARHTRNLAFQVLRGLQKNSEAGKKKEEISQSEKNGFVFSV